MYTNTMNWWRHSAVGVAILALSTACADSAALGPDLETNSLTRFESVSNSAQLQDGSTASALGAEIRVPDLGACNILQVPGSAKVVTSMYATGVQIYNWNGTSWSFVAPEATLFSNGESNGQVGIHYGGPTWESVNGGKVYGSVLQRCTIDSSTIPWLLLAATPDGPGIFHRVSYIHRVNTTGGIAPSAPGTFVGEIARVPYTADYVFYRNQ